VSEAVRSIGVTQFTYYRWRKEFGGLKTDQVKRLKELEKENERLRKKMSGGRRPSRLATSVFRAKRAAVMARVKYRCIPLHCDTPQVGDR
jgi:hypothetical protein